VISKIGFRKIFLSKKFLNAKPILFKNKNTFPVSNFLEKLQEKSEMFSFYKKRVHRHFEAGKHKILNKIRKKN